MSSPFRKKDPPSSPKAQTTSSTPHKWFRPDSYAVHAVIITAICLITTPVLYFAQVWGWVDPRAVSSATNTTNIVALIYAVYAYYLFDKSKQDTYKKLKEKGFEPMTLEEGIAEMYSAFGGFSDLVQVKNKIVGIGYDIDSLMPLLDEVLLFYHDHKNEVRDFVEILKWVMPLAPVVYDEYGPNLKNLDKLSYAQRREVVKEMLERARKENGSA